MLGVKPHQLEAKGHRVQVKGYPQRSVHIADVANHARVVTGEPPIGSASIKAKRGQHVPPPPLGGPDEHRLPNPSPAT